MRGLAIRRGLALRPGLAIRRGLDNVLRAGGLGASASGWLRCPSACHLASVLLLGLVTLTSAAASAQPTTQSAGASNAAACPAGNLLAGKTPQPVGGVRAIGRTNDNIAAPEGALWDAPLAAILESTASGIIWDLGALTKLEAIWIQGDANDYYTVSGSLDGTTYADLGRIEPVDGDGLRGRKILFNNAAVRYVRVGNGEGDRFYSISEVQLFCQMPNPFPPQLRVDPAPIARVVARSWWNDETSARWELTLAVLGLLLLAWRPERSRRPGEGVPPGAQAPFLEVTWDLVRTAGSHLGALVMFWRWRPKELGPKAPAHARVTFLRRLRDRSLAVLGILAALTYINFFSFHFGNFIHDWEWTHYYVGSKYFPELSYDRLYECIATADAEDGLRRRVEQRKLTNLRTNKLEGTAEVLANPDACKRNFTPERWSAFKKDVKFFRDRQSAKRWDDLQTDHGYNGTPVWNIAGTLLSNLGPATVNQLYTLAMFDPLYLLATYAIIWWAFGWRVLAVALLAFATNFPSRFYWTGGSFLRWDWLFYSVAAIACLRKNRPYLAGAALAYATLLRVFPGFMFLGPGLGFLYHAWKHKELHPRYTRFIAGAAIATTLLVPLSLAVSGGVHGYRRFVENTVKHKETPLTNYMGVRTVLAYRPDEVGRLLKDDRMTDPWIKWKEARITGWKNARPVYILIVLGFIAMIGLAARHVEPWIATALGVAFIPIGVELTCYYYAFIIGLAVLWQEREEVGTWLLFLTAYTQFAAWAPLRGMPNWLDEQYTYMSLATVIVFGAICWFFRRPVSADAAMVGAVDEQRAANARRPSKRTPAAVAPGFASTGDAPLAGKTGPAK